MLEFQIRQTFISNFTALRKQAKYSQNTIAEKLGVTQKVVGAWEEGRSFPSIEMVLRISDHFDRDLREMLTINLND